MPATWELMRKQAGWLEPFDRPIWAFGWSRENYWRLLPAYQHRGVSYPPPSRSMYLPHQIGGLPSAGIARGGVGIDEPLAAVIARRAMEPLPTNTLVGVIVGSVLFVFLAGLGWFMWTYRNWLSFAAVQPEQPPPPLHRRFSMHKKLGKEHKELSKKYKELGKKYKKHKKFGEKHKKFKVVRPQEPEEFQERESTDAKKPASRVPSPEPEKPASPAPSPKGKKPASPAPSPKGKKPASPALSPKGKKPASRVPSPELKKEASRAPSPEPEPKPEEPKPEEPKPEEPKPDPSDAAEKAPSVVESAPDPEPELSDAAADPKKTPLPTLRPS
uniref:Uncharacterized protein n=1 Tax=Pyricularia oryzae (strain P131) TaxID=1143193 RepID=L7JJX8_PYRO1